MSKHAKTSIECVTIHWIGALLIARAAGEGVSLNTLVLSFITEGLGKR
jgi:predicted HicB family RNase H-like nuclease